MSQASTDQLSGGRSVVLVVDDEKDHADAMAEGLRRAGHDVLVAYGGNEAIERVREQRIDVILTDLMMPDVDGLAVLDAARTGSPGTEVILVTAHSSVDTCRRALQRGAYDYVEKPVDLDELRTVTSRAIERNQLLRDQEELRIRLDVTHGIEGIVGNSPAMLRVIETIRRIAPTNTTVLIQGESGTGKELVAEAIHRLSRRRNRRFVPLNCAAISEGILESELFGHVKGSFTGAAADRDGRFEHADGGTLFLDEVGDMPASTQVKLLRVLESGEIIRVGSNDSRSVDVRVISATNRDLDEAVAAREFREDLFFRLKVVTINLPPLREHREDIPLLIEHYIDMFSKEHGKQINGVTADARRILTTHPWPGNVRQIRNTLESMVVLASGDVLGVEDLPEAISPRTDEQSSHMASLTGISIQEAEKELIRNTLRMVEGNREKAASILGIGERTLYRKLKEYDLS